MNLNKGKPVIAQILNWDFDKIVLAHGDIVEEDAKEKFRAAFSWMDNRNRNLALGLSATALVGASILFL